MGKFLIKKTEAGFLFHLRAANGETIGISEIYNSAQACHNGILSVQNHAVNAAVEDQTLPRFRELKNPKFEIYKDQDSKFHFRLKAHDGQEILASQAYTAKASCKNGIRSVMLNAKGAEIIEVLG